MIQRRAELRRSLPPLIASIPVTIIFFAVLGIVLTAAGPKGLDVNDEQTSSWIVVLYGLPTVLALVLTIRHHQPLLVTGNIFAIIFFASLGDRMSFAELSGASILAGAIVLAAGIFGLTRWIAAWVPAPIVYGLIAGAVMPFVVDVFTSLSTSHGDVRIPIEAPMMVGAAFIAYLVSQRLFGTRVPPILPAFGAGLLVAALTGQLGDVPTSFSLPSLDIVEPDFSLAAIATATPVLVALMTVQSNIPSIIFMKSQGFRPPERALDVISGAGTIVGSFAGPVAVSLALPPLLLTAGPETGAPSLRYRAVYLPACAGLLIAFFAMTATEIAVLIPSILLLTMAGLALIGALVNALREIAKGPLVLGPVFAFAIALSEMTVFGLGPFFWSLVLGALISLLLERDGWHRLRNGVAEPREGVVRESTSEG